MADKNPLRDLFLDPSLLWLVERLKVRVQRGQALDGSITLQAASDDQRSAIDSLLGRSSSCGKSVNVRLDVLRDHLHEAGLIDQMEDVVEACFGVVENQKAKSDALLGSWSQNYSWATEQLTGDETGIRWIESLRKDGLVKRFSKGDPDTGHILFQTAITIWKHLPCSGITLAEFAGQVTGDTHALDRGTPLSPIVLRGLQIRTGIKANRNALNRRLAWDSVGVLVDRLSSPALTFNLSANPETPLDLLLKSHNSAGHPAYLTYRSVEPADSFFPLPSGMEDIYVVENPSIVESAANQLGKHCLPLICTEGVPASAVMRILRLLHEAGARIHLRADFDWTGLRIIDQMLIALPNAKLWRMDMETYLEIPATAKNSGKIFSSAWCRELSDSMAERGLAAFEEQVTNLLIEDLDRRLTVLREIDDDIEY